MASHFTQSRSISSCNVQQGFRNLTCLHLDLLATTSHFTSFSSTMSSGHYIQLVLSQSPVLTVLSAWNYLTRMSCQLRSQIHLPFKCHLQKRRLALVVVHAMSTCPPHLYILYILNTTVSCYIIHCYVISLSWPFPSTRIEEIQETFLNTRSFTTISFWDLLC